MRTFLVSSGPRAALDRILRVFLAVLVALPLGAGGICCCLFEKPVQSPEVATARPSCCAAAETPASPDEPSKDEDCHCPARELAEAPSSSATPELVTPGPTGLLALAAVPAVGALLPESPVRSARAPDPPPGRSGRMHVRLAVFRC
ncbi:MAG: hypothetical protein KC591_00425 [Gemmatimonadetes bacterium]|nr:hypothetical protein [Gemmatimonadota bacterium]